MMKGKISFWGLCLIGMVLCMPALKAQTPQTKGPKITLMAPAENDILQIGKAVHFDMDLADTKLLDSYRVEIHDNFDGHAHTGGADEVARPTVFDKTYDVSGSTQKQVHHHGVVIPEKAREGVYHFIIICKNVDGGESRVIRTVTLSKGQGTLYH
ncbi:hypothetical protein M2137_002027 [Parabacteroides sp. PFB2-10]|uniref:DUF4625 domain-containing protein n=1 Tax=Parabacteroides sp. PFB2-10 TaxID=1742405 RepID=UPI0024749F5F|nr:DUF4625 domain-containing protein [Parabacteroides sp. PFB2-10]MDH6313237.1 hypothetical protein [Parabacteroides sp. PFB2-10]